MLYESPIYVMNEQLMEMMKYMKTMKAYICTLQEENTMILAHLRFPQSGGQHGVWVDD